MRVRSAAVALLLALTGCSLTENGASPRQVRGTGAGGIAFVDNQVCAECHEFEFEQWQGSHHRLAMQLATSESVLGDFDDATFTHYGVTTRFFVRGGRYFVNTEGPGGEMADFQIAYTFGVHPLQQYLVEFPGGRLQCLGVTWDSEKGRWYHLYPDERINPDDPLHWTGGYQTWNLQCAECHSTNLRKNYDHASETYRTEWDEINVSCQACHGPAEEHVEWARALPEGYEAKPGEHKLVVEYRLGDSRYEVDSCARCHSRRQLVSVDNQHGRPLLDDYLVSSLREGLYHADGQILDEVYVYGSFLQSKMYQQGVRCSDCHNPHSLGFESQGQVVCTRCHQVETPEEFPTLKSKLYNTPEHHHHAEGGKGAECVACHMPSKTYMVVDPRRDHSFRIPRPDLTVKIGTPNACNQCHADKSAEWAADAVDRWYGKIRDEHYGELFANARLGQPSAEGPLIDLARDPEQPSILRATAIELMTRFGEDSLAAMSALAADEDPLLRAKAVAGLDRLPPQARVGTAAPLLTDDVRAVRIEAARVLASVAPLEFSAQRKGALRAALEEYKAVQLANTDTPGGNLSLAILYSGLGQADEAERYYRKALEREQFFLSAQVNLATFYNQQGRNDDAEKVLREAIETAPEEGELRYSLGLLLAEDQRLEEASQSLRQAAELMPNRARVRYNYALALQHLGRAVEAEQELLKAHRTAPEDGAGLNALAILYIQQRQLDQAAFYAQKMVDLEPNAPGPRQLMQQIEAEMRVGR